MRACEREGESLRERGREPARERARACEREGGRQRERGREPAGYRDVQFSRRPTALKRNFNTIYYSYKFKHNLHFVKSHATIMFIIHIQFILLNPKTQTKM